MSTQKSQDSLGGRFDQRAQKNKKGIKTQKSLAKRLFMSLFALSAFIAIATGVGVTAVCFHVYEQDAANTLAREAQDVAARLPTDNNAREAWMADLPFGEDRATLIAADGKVLYDSVADARTMDNHANRSEVVAAKRNGEAVMMRMSGTLRTDTLYAAYALSDGTVVRISESRHSLASFMGSLAPAIAAGLVFGVAIAYIASRFLVRRIIRPFDTVDLSHPSEGAAYEEMRPLLDRIDTQRRQLVMSNEELRRAANMRREFTSNVSHELKTPLQVIGGYAELMRDGITKPEDNRRFAGLIYDEAFAMRTLVDDVLTLSHLDEGGVSGTNPVPVDMVAVTDHVLDRLRPNAVSAGVEVRREGVDEFFVKGNPELLGQMVYNLVDNAIRYCSDGGHAVVHLSKDGDRARIAVDDDGPGVPPEARERVFERFYRVDESRSRETGGTGLGLAIVKHTAESHGGSVSVGESPEGGASFVVGLPCG